MATQQSQLILIAQENYILKTLFYIVIDLLRKSGKSILPTGRNSI